MKRFVIQQDLLRQSRIPARFWNMGRDDYQGNLEAYEVAVTYGLKFAEAKRKRSGLYLFGAHQTFKTFLAATAAKLLLANGFTVQYFHFDELVDYHFGRSSDGVFFPERFRHSDLVVFDGISVPENGKATAQALTRAVRIRSDEGLPYIVSSVLSFDDLAIEYGKNLSGRMSYELSEVPCSVDPDVQHKIDSSRSKSVSFVLTNPSGDEQDD